MPIKRVREGTNAQADRETTEEAQERVMRNLVVKATKAGERDKRPKIDERDLAIPVRDHAGQMSLNVRCRIGEMRRAEIVLARGEYPMFETLSDVWRAALHMGLSTLEGMRIEAGVFKLTRFMTRLAAAEMEAIEIGNSFDRLKDVITRNLELDCEEAAKSLVRESLGAAAQLERPVHREHFKAMLEKRWGFLLDPKRKDELEAMKKNAKDSAPPEGTRLLPADGKAGDSLEDHTFDD